MLNGISNSVFAAHVNNRNNYVQQSQSVRKSGSEESKVNAEERNETTAAERIEQASKSVGSKVDRFA